MTLLGEANLLPSTPYGGLRHAKGVVNYACAVFSGIAAEMPLAAFL
jgi:hypothetical protein